MVYSLEEGDEGCQLWSEILNLEQPRDCPLQQVDAVTGERGMRSLGVGCRVVQGVLTCQCLP